MKQAFLNQIYETKSFEWVNFGSVTNGPSSPPEALRKNISPLPTCDVSPLSQQEV